MPEKEKPRTFSFKDTVMIVGALGALVFHAGTFYAVKATVEKHDREIEALKQENNRQQIEIELLKSKVKI